MINSFSIKAVIASEKVATGAAAARRIVCTALQHVETAKALHANPDVETIGRRHRLITLLYIS